MSLVAGLNPCSQGLCAMKLMQCKNPWVARRKISWSERLWVSRPNSWSSESIVLIAQAMKWNNWADQDACLKWRKEGLEGEWLIGCGKKKNQPSTIWFVDKARILKRHFETRLGDINSKVGFEKANHKPIRVTLLLSSRYFQTPFFSCLR